jgi:hypothetical protein
LPKYGWDGLKNEGRQGPLNCGLFSPVFYLFGGRFAVKRIVIEVVFSDVPEKKDILPDICVLRR